MDQHHEHYHKPEKQKAWWRTPAGIVAIFFFGLIGYFLIAEHKAHLLGNWIWLILLLCPLLHIFMHGGHGHPGNSDGRDGE